MEGVVRNTEERLGSRRMGSPARPTAHPHNQQAAQWSPRSSDDELFVYVLTADDTVRQRHGVAEHILEAFNNWTIKAHDFAHNLWNSLKGAPSKSELVLGKMRLTAKAIKKGGFEELYKQTFPTKPNEELKDCFACYLSTTTGPVAGTLYISNIQVGFCSDRPLSFNAPSGQEVWSYYKLLIPLERISRVNPVTFRKDLPEKYVEIDTVDGHEFWFMGFINYDKVCNRFQESLSEQVASRMAAEL